MVFMLQCNDPFENFSFSMYKNVDDTCFCLSLENLLQMFEFDMNMFCSKDKYDGH